MKELDYLSQVSGIFNRGSKYTCWILIILSLLFLVGCYIESGIKYDFDKQAAFKSLFSIGSSREEVEIIIEELEGVNYDSEIQFNDDTMVFYNTSVELYGTYGFTFIYDTDMKLMYVIGQE